MPLGLVEGIEGKAAISASVTLLFPSVSISVVLLIGENQKMVLFVAILLMLGVGNMAFSGVFWLVFE